MITAYEHRERDQTRWFHRRLRSSAYRERRLRRGARRRQRRGPSLGRDDFVGRRGPAQGELRRDRRTATRRANPGHRRRSPGQIRESQSRQSLHPVPATTRSDARHAGDVARHGETGRGLPGAGGLAREREQQYELLAARAEFLPGLIDCRALLASQSVPTRSAKGAPRSRYPRPRPGDAVGLLLRMGLAIAAGIGVRRRARQNREPSPAPPAHRVGTTRQLLLHPPGRIRRSGRRVELRHPARTIHPLRRLELQADQASRAGVRLQHQRADTGRISNTVHQHYTRPDAPPHAARRPRHHRRGATGEHVRRFPARDEFTQPRLRRGDV